MDSIAIDFYRAIHYSAYVKHGLAIACHLSVCEVRVLWSHRLDILETNSTHRRRSSVNFGRQDIFARKLCLKKLTKYSNFTWYLPEKKLSKCPNFYYIYPNINKIWYLSENVEILLDNCPKNKQYFPEFYWEGHVGCPPYPTSMTARTISPTCIFALRSPKAIHLLPGEQEKIRGGPFGISAWAGYLQTN